jgi:NADH-ubiquinone oxidoreductase chain 1
LLIPILVNVAFITLLERKILGYSQLRKGPNKVSIIGIAQPFNDAIKLFTKEIVYPKLSNIFQYLISPFCGLIIVLITCILIPFKEIILPSRITIIFLYIIMRMNIYPVLISGWASNRKYALIGALRAVAQTVSYEVCLALILLFYLALTGRISLLIIILSNSVWNKIIILIPIAGIWLVSCLAETNRTPFDFAEGESELVSGFNIEYGRLGFALIFIAEYARIFLIGLIFSFIFVTSRCINLWTYFFSTLLVRFWVWVRTTFPRYRYDKLIRLAWKIYLPLTLYSFFYRIFISKK